MTDATVYHLNLKFLPRFLQKRSQEGTDIMTLRIVTGSEFQHVYA
jgi:hypothetical protein